MSQSSDISSRFWNQPQKADEEMGREHIFIDDIIQKAHIEREILSQLDGVETALDAGAGYGRFSILLAKQGLSVTHLDLSEPMLEKAKELADRAGVLDRMTFVRGRLEELQAFGDRQFDMVLSIDAPVSYTYPEHEPVIGELVRICGKRLILSVYSRLAWTYQFDPAQKLKYILDRDSNDPLVRWTMEAGVQQRADHRPNMEAIRAFFRTGLMDDPEQIAAAFENGETP